MARYEIQFRPTRGPWSKPLPSDRVVVHHDSGTIEFDANGKTYFEPLSLVSSIVDHEAQP